VFFLVFVFCVRLCSVFEHCVCMFSMFLIFVCVLLGLCVCVFLCVSIFVCILCFAGFSRSQSKSPTLVWDQSRPIVINPNRPILCEILCKLRQNRPTSLGVRLIG